MGGFVMKARFIKTTIIATGIGLLGGCASLPQVAGQGATPTQRPIIFNMGSSQKTENKAR